MYIFTHTFIKTKPNTSRDFQRASTSFFYGKLVQKNLNLTQSLILYMFIFSSSTAPDKYSTWF